MYERIFVIPEVARVHELFDELFTVIAALERQQRQLRSPVVAGLAAQERQAVIAYAQFNRDLDDVSRQAAAAAKEAMVRKLRSTARRPDAGRRVRLEQLLDARPLSPAGKLATGVVGIAPHEKLDRAEYWHTQEEGYAGNVGRRLQGFYFGPGGAGRGRVPHGLSGRLRSLAGTQIGFPADPQYAGGGGPHPIFQTGPGPGMTIAHPIVGRHFIRDGANEALVDWRLGVNRVQARAIRALGVL